MHSYKIEHFERDGRGHSFPWWRQISELECNAIRGELIARLALPESTDSLELLRFVKTRETPLPDVDALAPGFNLRETAAAVGIMLGQKVLLNWYRFDEIDQMNTSDLSEFFDDIWYPSSDDLDVFDESLRWIISVDHHGAVAFVKL